MINWQEVFTIAWCLATSCWIVIIYIGLIYLAIKAVNESHYL